MYKPPETSVFYEAWLPGETPHAIKTTRFDPTKEEQEKVPYNSYGSQKDRTLKNHVAALNFEHEEIPENGALLVIGSGVTRRFERELHEARPDILVASIDPLLRYGVRERVRLAIQSSASRVAPGIDSMGYGVEFPYEVLSEHSYYRAGAAAGAVAVTDSIRQGLPFKKESFDGVVAMHSVPQYSRATEIPYLLEETIRVMKRNTTARFYPFFLEDLWALGAKGVAGHITQPVIDAPKWYDVTDYSPLQRRVAFQKI